MRKIIPNDIRIAVFVVIIAGFVTIVDLLLQAYVPALSESLGVFIPLIVVNCIILGRAEGFASKNGVGASAVDGICQGIGYTVVLVIMCTVRELLGAGTPDGHSDHARVLHAGPDARAARRRLPVPRHAHRRDAVGAR